MAVHKKPTSEILNEKSMVLGKVSEISSVITNISAAIIGFTFVLYAVGFIIVNGYLTSYGVKEFVLSKPSYLLAGISFAFYLVLVIGGPAFGFTMLIRKSKSGFGSTFYVGLVLIVPYLFAMNLISFLTYGTMVSSSNQSFSVFLQNYSRIGLESSAAAFLIGFCLLTAWGISLSPEGKKQRNFTLNLIMNSVFLFAIFFSLLADWSSNIYPNMRQEFGGGKPLLVRVVFRDAKTSNNFVEIGGQAAKNISQPMPLIDETEKTITVLLPNGSASKIDKELINLILFIPHEEGISTTQTTPTFSTP